MLPKLILAFAISAVSMTTYAQQKTGLNDQFNYNQECKDAVTAVGQGASKEVIEVLTVLNEDLDTLDNMVRIMNNPDEEMDLRQSLLHESSSFRSSIFYGLDSLTQTDSDKIITSCGLEKIKDELHLDEKILESILIGENVE